MSLLHHINYKNEIFKIKFLATDQWSEVFKPTLKNCIHFEILSILYKCIHLFSQTDSFLNAFQPNFY